MKCIEKYYTSVEGASQKFLDMFIDHRNLLWNINYVFLNFPDFQQNSKYPWLIIKFADFSQTLNFPDFSLTSGNPDTGTPSIAENGNMRGKKTSSILNVNIANFRSKICWNCSIWGNSHVVRYNNSVKMTCFLSNGSVQVISFKLAF